jgi:hypothetical protein
MLPRLLFVINDKCRRWMRNYHPSHSPLMETQFALLLPNVRKGRPVLLGFCVLYVAVWLAWLASMMHRLGFSRGVQDGLFLLVLVSNLGIAGLPWLVRKLCYEPTTVTVRDDRLVVRSQVSGEERAFPFAAIARYRVLTSRYGATLMFRYHDGSKHGLSSNDFSLLQVAPALTKALQRYEQQHNEPPKYRDNSFFGNPVSTWVLAFLAPVVALVSWAVGFVTPPEPGFFVLFFLYFLLVLYLIAWYEARQKRRNY